jgi:hypothetical protein
MQEDLTSWPNAALLFSTIKILLEHYAFSFIIRIIPFHSIMIKAKEEEYAI